MRARIGFIFVHSDPKAGSTELRRQDADIRPAEVILDGEASLTTTPGWNPYVAAAVLAAAVTMLPIGTVFALTARILGAAAAGEALSTASTRRVRTIGVVVLALAASGPLLGGLTRPDVLGYWTETSGSGLSLVPDDDLGVPLADRRARGAAHPGRRDLPARRGPPGRGAVDRLMTIEINLDRLLLERRMTLTELAGRVGITVANLSILKTGKAKAVRLATLDAICRELGCQPGDLLGYTDAD